MEDAPPEDPDALALDVEERPGIEPPGVGLRGEVAKPGARQVKQPIRAGFRGEHARRCRLGTAEEFAEETAFGEKLVAEDFDHRGRFGMRAKVESVRGELLEDG